jgi:hypothetical protein
MEGGMGRFLRGAAKLVAALAVLVGAGFYVLAYHSTVAQELVCKGHWKDQPSEPETAYVDLTEYRWWLNLFNEITSNSPGPEGHAKVQTDKKLTTEYFSDVRRVGDGRLAIYTFRNFDFTTRTTGTMRGGYRAANREIVINLGEWPGTFVGTCEPDARQNR